MNKPIKYTETEPRKLPPCPFCGTEGLKAEYDSYGTTLYYDDGCHGQFNFPVFINEVDEMWRRHLKANSVNTTQH